MKKRKAEASTGAINYALDFIILFSILIFYMFARYRVNLYFLQRTIENNLYMIESSALTLESDPIFHSDEFYREYIIHDIDTVNNSVSVAEAEKLNVLGTFLEERVKKQLDLKNDVNPNSGILKVMCSDKGKVYLTDVKVIQPHYVQNVSVQATNEEDSPYTISFSYSIDKWVVYELLYENNHYKGCNKLEIREGNDPPELKYSDPLGDNLAHGATIEASIECKLVGINDIFHGVETTGRMFRFNTVKGQEEIETGKRIFTVHNPLEKTLDNNLTYCLSTDIVITANDNRNVVDQNGQVTYKGTVQKRQTSIFND